MLHLSKSLNFFEDCQNVIIVLKNEKYKLFLSNEPYSTFRGQKLTKVEGFKAHTTKIRVSSEFLSAFVPSVGGKGRQANKEAQTFQELQ